MALWAIGQVGEPARIFVEASDSALVIAAMRPGDALAPITEAQKNHGQVRLLGDMQVELIESGE